MKLKLLFDQNISFRITKKINEHFPDCKHVSDCELQDSNDVDIWEYAKRNTYAVVTFDADFYDMSLINGHPPKIIWIRTGNLTTLEISEMLISKKTSIEKFLHDDDHIQLSCLEII